MSNKCFEIMDKFLDYVGDDIERFGNFEFKICIFNKEHRYKFYDYSKIKVINETYIEYEGNKFNIWMIEPLC